MTTEKLKKKKKLKRKNKEFNLYMDNTLPS